MPKTRSPGCRPWSPAGTRSATPAKSMPTTNGYCEAAVSRPSTLLSSGLTPANRTRTSHPPSTAGTGSSWTDAASPKFRTANARIPTSLHWHRPENTAPSRQDVACQIVLRDSQVGLVADRPGRVEVKGVVREGNCRQGDVHPGRACLADECVHPAWRDQGVVFRFDDQGRRGLVRDVGRGRYRLVAVRILLRSAAGVLCERGGAVH